MKEKQLLTSERLLTAIVSMLGIFMALVAWIYVDNKQSQQANNDQQKELIEKIDSKVENHVSCSEHRFNNSEQRILAIELKQKYRK